MGIDLFARLNMFFPRNYLMDPAFFLIKLYNKFSPYEALPGIWSYTSMDWKFIFLLTKELILAYTLVLRFWRSSTNLVKEMMVQMTRKKGHSCWKFMQLKFKCIQKQKITRSSRLVCLYTGSLCILAMNTGQSRVKASFKLWGLQL